MNIRDFILDTPRWREQQRVAQECKKIIEMIRQNPHITPNEIGLELDITYATAQNRLKKLHQAGVSESKFHL